MAYQCIPQLKKEFPELKVIDILHLERVGPTRDEMLWVDPYVDNRVCISHSLRKYMIAKLGSENGKADRFTMIYNGIDLNYYKDDQSLKGKFKLRYQISEDVKLITFVGRFSEEKNPLLFVDVAKKVLDEHENHKIKFIMTGDGNLHDQTKAKVKAYGLSRDILLTGVINNIRELIVDTHILVFVSDNEGIPLTVTEALAMDTPVVSTIVGAVDEVLQDAVNGYLIEKNAKVKDQVAAKILTLLADDELYQKLSRNTRSSVINKFSQDQMCAQYQELFEERLHKR